MPFIHVHVDSDLEQGKMTQRCKMAWFPYLQLQLWLYTAQSCQTRGVVDFVSRKQMKHGFQNTVHPQLTPQSVCIQNPICFHCLKTSSSPPRCWPLTLKIRVKFPYVIYNYIYIYIHTYTFSCPYTCTYIYIYIYLHIHIYT